MRGGSGMFCNDKRLATKGIFGKTEGGDIRCLRSLGGGPCSFVKLMTGNAPVPVC